MAHFTAVWTPPDFPTASCFSFFSLSKNHYFYWIFVNFIKYILIIFRTPPLSLPFESPPPDFTYSVIYIKAYEVKFVSLNVSCCVFIHWSLANLSRVTTLMKTNFSSPSSYQLSIVPQLRLGLLIHFPTSMLGFCLPCMGLVHAFTIAVSSYE